jgi:hypothetical protein
MRKSEDYLHFAEECRRLAMSATDEPHRATLLDMAQTWTDLAAARRDELERKKRIAKLDNGDRSDHA